MTTEKPHFTLLARSFAGGPPKRRVAAILFGLWALLFFAALFSPPLLDDADATHAQAARAMATTGDLVTLKVDGVRYLEKAPLPYWLAALSFRIFGFNAFAAHLPQALAVLLLALLGHRWANQAFGARTGFYTAIAVLTSAGVFLFTRILIPEVLLSVLLGAAMFAFLKSLGPIAVEGPPAFAIDGIVAERPAEMWYAGPYFYPAVMWFSLALAVLTKGLVALVFFFATALLFLLLTGTMTDWRKLKPFSGLLLFLAIAAPWHILAGLRNTGGMDGHGFWWFYFWNEHVLRFLGKRVPMDYNRLPGYLFWSLHLVWLFPWTLFLPLGMTAIWRRMTHQHRLASWTNVRLTLGKSIVVIAAYTLVAVALERGLGVPEYTALFWTTVVILAVVVMFNRRRFGIAASPFQRIDPEQRSILLLSLFAGIVLLFFSLSTNQEYYTFPAYLPILLLISATITRAEQTYALNPSAQRWIGFAHAAFTIIGAVVAVLLLYGLWSSRHLPYVADIGDLLAHRSVGDYTLSMSHFFDLTTGSFAALRFPAALAAIVFAVGPSVAWMLRVQRRHLAATTAIALTSAGFLFAAHLALVRFAPMLSSKSFATEIQRYDDLTPVLLFGDQAYGSSIPFYLGRPVYLVDGRTTSMLFGSTFPDAADTHTFLTPADLQHLWKQPASLLLFVPAERRAEALRLLPPNPTILKDESGKLLLTNHPDLTN